jgi:septum formation protein
MLEVAGVAFEAVASDLDENSVKLRNLPPDETATKLAAAKALAVSSDRPENWVIGSDSIVTVDSQLFGKPRNRDEAAKHLRFFSGKAMNLVSAVALSRRGKLSWAYCDRAVLSVRILSDAFITNYLDAEWPEVGYTVGVFRLEARGVQLFSSIEGDHFTILGMPLIPLLGALRDRGLLLA